jgi:transposase
MMGIKEEQGPKLFYRFNLSNRIPLEHPLRQLKSLLKLDFMYKELKPKYGERGNVSIAPPVLMKMMLLLVLYNVPSERELMRTLPYRLDWLWFLGYDIDEEIPNHSVLSKARKRWGEELFQKLFVEVLNLALESGLIDGNKIFVDSSLVDAAASKNSVEKVTHMKLVEDAYKEMTNRLDEKSVAAENPNNKSKDKDRSKETESKESELDSKKNAPLRTEHSSQTIASNSNVKEGTSTPKPKVGSESKKNALEIISGGMAKENKNNSYGCKCKGIGVNVSRKDVNKFYKSTSDGDAEFSKDNIYGSTKLRHKVHRSVDEAFEIITSCHTTSGAVDESKELARLVISHILHIGKKPGIVVGDNKYGTKENLVNLKKLGIQPHMKSLSQTQAEILERQGKFTKSDFEYNASGDYYICPAGKQLIKRSYNSAKESYEYKASKQDCDGCILRTQCTASQSSGRVLRRYREEDILELALADSCSKASKKDQKKRHHFMERSFAAGIRYGYKKARWRGQWRVSIQQLLVATVQNLLKIMRYGKRPDKNRAVVYINRTNPEKNALHNLFLNLKKGFCFALSLVYRKNREIFRFYCEE